MKKGVGLGMFVLGVLLMPLMAAAQPGGGGAGGGPGGQGGPGGGFGPGGPGGRGGFNMLSMMQEQIGASDDEWKVIEPKLQKVMDLQQQTGGRGGRGGRGGGGPGGPGGQGGPGAPGGQGMQGRGQGGQQADNPVSRAMADLRTTLDNPNATNEMIKAKLTVLRTAREKAKTELTAAQADLKEILTPRQEAVLVTFGMLD